VATVHGLLLTGGRSQRMGRDKATIVVRGLALAELVAGVLTQVAGAVLEVGPARSGLPSVIERPPGGGPLAAVATGWHELTKMTGQRRPVLVLACDLPDVTVKLLRWLADYPDPAGMRDEDIRCSVVPVVDGMAQPLCARWSVSDLDRAVALLGSGHRSLRHGFGDAACFPAEDQWTAVAAPSAFADLDTPEDLAQRGWTQP
jgi:molybdenum cofactor guanylyltransferase